MITSEFALAVVLAIVAGSFIFLIGVVTGMSIKRKDKTAGSLLIDKSGEKDRWTFLMDEDLGEIEEEKYIRLRIEKRE